MSDSSTENALQPELFHRIAEPESAEARRLLVELDLLDKVRIRNLTYAEVQSDFTARGGTRAPALWDGATLLEGIDAVRPALEALAARRC